MDKQACKSIICHADNITDEISPLALSFNFAETFLEKQFQFGALQIHSLLRHELRFVCRMFDFILNCELFGPLPGHHSIAFLFIFLNQVRVAPSLWCRIKFLTNYWMDGHHNSDTDSWSTEDELTLAILWLFLSFQTWDWHFRLSGHPSSCCRHPCSLQDEW